MILKYKYILYINFIHNVFPDLRITGLKLIPDVIMRQKLLT